ncbi:MAG TPA: P1 family peptidase [Acidimicrobiales bacterium]|nr:P1 family peptidase [Acidimicrobiales bacterium]
MITDVRGVRVGHWTDAVGQTGCTAVVLPKGCVASGEVRGGAPGTRDFALLDPTRLVQHVDVVMLSGGSAYGLATADGAMRWCEQHRRGLKTARGGLVPIVVGMIVFDLAVGDRKARPDADAGYAACANAGRGRFDVGRVGAGTGATIGKLGGRVADRRPGGLGTATARRGELVVSALMVVNAVGFLRGEQAAPVSGHVPANPIENTTIGVVVTNASLSKTDCFLTAQSAHGGIARAIDPAHTRVDGDAIVAAATGQVRADVESVRMLAAHAVEAAIRNAVSAANP